MLLQLSKAATHSMLRSLSLHRHVKDMWRREVGEVEKQLEADAKFVKQRRGRTKQSSKGGLA